MIFYSTKCDFCEETEEHDFTYGYDQEKDEYTKTCKECGFTGIDEEKHVLTEAKTTALETLEKYEAYMKANNTDTKYNALISSLATAKTSIENSNSIKEIQSTLDAILVAMKDVDTAMADLETKKQDAIDDLQEYVDVLNDVEGLDSDDITKIKNFVKQAKDAVNAANSETEIGEAQETFEVLMTQYQEVGVEKAKQKAIATLNEHRDASKPAMEKLIDDTIADIEKLDDADQIGTKLEQALAKIAPLEVAQKGAYETLEAYENYLAKNTVEGEDFILGEIETVKALIDNAADETSVTSAISGFNTFMETYKSVVDAVKLQVATDKLEEKYQEVVTKLNPYLANSNENVKPLADAALKAIDDAKKVADEKGTITEIEKATTTISNLFYGCGGKNFPNPSTYNDKYIPVNDVTIRETSGSFLGYEAALKHNVEFLDKKDKEDKAARAEAYENATKKLDLYETVLKNETAVSTLKLNAEDISRIQEMIDATRSSIAKAAGANGIDSAMDLLSGSEGYLDTYYKKYVDYVAEYEFINTKDTALSKLNEYKETYKDNETLSEEIEEAITEIDGYKQPTKTAQDITAKLNAVERTIDLENKKAALDAEKTRLINKYREVVEDKKASSSVKGIATKAISEINQVTLDTAENFETKMKDLKDKEKDYDEQLKDTLADIADQKQKDYQDALKVAMEKVNEYVTISENAKRTAVVNQLNNYKKLINNASDEEGVLEAEKQLDKYIQESCAVLKLQYDAIMNLNALVEEKYSEDAEIKAIVNDGIEAIRKINVTDWSDTETMTTEIDKIAKFDVDGENLTAGSVNDKITEITTARSTLTSEKTSAKTEIDNLITKEAEKDPLIEADLNNLVKDYKDQIDAVTSDDAEYTKINGIKAKALQAIKGYMEGKIASSKEPVDTTLNGQSELEEEFGEEITFESMQTDVKVTESKTPTKGYDEEYKVSGTLNKTENFEWFNNSDPNEQSGNYLSMKFVNKYAGKITCELTPSSSGESSLVTLDDDGILIVRVTDKDKQTIIVRYYDSEEDETPAKTVLYTLTELDCKNS